MTNALLIRHSAKPRADAVSAWLVAQGVSLDRCCPAHGDPLPPAGIHDLCVIYGGPQSANDPLNFLRDEMRFIEQWLAQERPLFAICLGAQLLARVLGACVAPHPQGQVEIGFYPLAPTRRGRELGFLHRVMRVYQWHREGFELPEGCEQLATGHRLHDEEVFFPCQAYHYQTRAWGVQFHPEMTWPIMAQWLGEAAPDLEAPGAHPEQHHDREVDSLAAVQNWLDGFMTRLLPLSA